MKKILVVVTVLLGLTGVGFAQNSPAEKYLLQYSARKNGWLINKHYDSLALLLDARSVYVHSNGWAQNAKEIIADMKSGKMLYQRISVAEAQARQYEKMVIVNGKGKFEGTMNGVAFAMDLVYTEVYLNRKNGWVLVSRHASKP